MLRMQFILPLQKSLRGPTRADPRSRGNSAQEGLEALGRQLRPRHMVLGGFLQPLDFGKHLLKLLLTLRIDAEACLVMHSSTKWLSSCAIFDTSAVLSFKDASSFCWAAIWNLSWRISVLLFVIAAVTDLYIREIKICLLYTSPSPRD